jgi:hypothetical protein
MLWFASCKAGTSSEENWWHLDQTQSLTAEAIFGEDERKIQANFFWR